MSSQIKTYKHSLIYKIVILCVLVCFSFLSIVPYEALAQGIFHLPSPGTAVSLTPSYVPVMLRGLQVNIDDPFSFDFIIDSGNTGLQAHELKEESQKLATYFLASLTTPEQDLWVNLSPYESDRIIPEALGHTQMGQDLLAQDYILKQLTASLMIPGSDTGKAFWQRVYKQAYAQYGTTDIPVDTFNKVWIVPERAVIYEDANRAFITESYLKVMLEEDYVALQENNDQASMKNDKGSDVKSTLASNIMRETLLPLIEQEVNHGQNFAQLRQMYHAMILATWYKQTLKESIINQVYSDQKKIEGIGSMDASAVDTIYAQYLKAYQKGVCDLIKVEYDPHEQRYIARKYFSGGFGTGDSAMISGILRRSTIDSAMGPTVFKNIFLGLLTGFVFSASVHLATPMFKREAVTAITEQMLEEHDAEFVFKNIPYYIHENFSERFIRFHSLENPQLALEHASSFIDEFYAQEIIEDLAKKEPELTLQHADQFAHKPYAQKIINNAVRDPRVGPTKTFSYISNFIDQHYAESIIEWAAHAVNPEAALKNALFFVNKSYGQEIIERSARQAGARSALMHAEYYADQPWAEDIIRWAAQSHPRSALEHAHYYADQPWAQNIVKLAAQKDPESALEYSRHFITQSYAQNIIELSSEVDPGSALQYAYNFIYETYAENVIRQASQSDPQLAMIFSKYFINEHYAHEIIQWIAQENPASAIASARYFINQPWGRKIFDDLAGRLDASLMLTHVGEFVDQHDAEKIIRGLAQKNPVFALNAADRFINQSYAQEIIEKSAEKSPRAALQYVQIFSKKPWAERVVLRAAEQAPRSAFQFLHHFIDEPYGKKAIEIAAKKNPRAALQYFSRYNRMPWAENIILQIPHRVDEWAIFAYFEIYESYFSTQELEEFVKQAAEKDPVSALAFVDHYAHLPQAWEIIQQACKASPHAAIAYEALLSPLYEKFPYLEEKIQSMRDAYFQDYRKEFYINQGEIQEIFLRADRIASLVRSGSFPAYRAHIERIAKRFSGEIPIRIIGFLNEEYVADLLIATELTGLSPEFIMASYAQEGGAMLHRNNGPYSSERLIDTYRDIGIDILHYELPGLLKMGIEIEIEKVLSNIHNEKDLLCRPILLKEKEALKAIAKMLKQKRIQLKTDVSNQWGINIWEQIADEEKDFWTYLYYNVGKTGGRRILYEKGLDWQREKSEGYRQVFFNAARTSGGAQLLRELGIFRSMTVDFKGLENFLKDSYDGYASNLNVSQIDFSNFLNQELDDEKLYKITQAFLDGKIFAWQDDQGIVYKVETITERGRQNLANAFIVKLLSGEKVLAWVSGEKIDHILEVPLSFAAEALFETSGVGQENAFFWNGLDFDADPMTKFFHNALLYRQLSDYILEEATQYQILAQIDPSTSALSTDQAQVASPESLVVPTTVADEHVGGIDFDSRHLDIQRTGDSSIEFNIPTDWQNVDLENIPGFIPVIINIVPITNFNALLGLVDDEDKDVMDLLGSHQQDSEREQESDTALALLGDKGWYE